jgi:hypothetical protein
MTRYCVEVLVYVDAEDGESAVDRLSGLLSHAYDDNGNPLGFEVVALTGHDLP